jgi:hypothetical protein
MGEPKSPHMTERAAAEAEARRAREAAALRENLRRRKAQARARAATNSAHPEYEDSAAEEIR